MVSNFPAATCSEAVFAEVASSPATIGSSATPAADSLKAGEIIFLGFVLAFCQVLDGILTAIGVTHFGITIEANLLLRYAMSCVGELAALAIFKIAAVLIIISLCYLASRVLWVRTAMKFLIAVYLFGAILPWGFILIGRII